MQQEKEKTGKLVDGSGDGLNKFVYPRKIMVDMDGVLVAFFELVSLYIPELTTDHAPENKAILYKFMDAAEEEFGLFANLPPKRDLAVAIAFLEQLQDKGYEIEILSSIGTTRTSKSIEANKNKWLDKYLKGTRLESIKRNFVEGSKQKGNYARPGFILIDDYKKPGIAFTEAGGIWIHHRNWNDTVEQLLQVLNID